MSLNAQQFGDDDDRLRWVPSAMTVEWNPKPGAPEADYKDESKSSYGDFCFDCGPQVLAEKQKAGLDAEIVGYHDNYEHACSGPQCVQPRITFDQAMRRRGW